jgi:hypothetical protein
MRTLSIVVTGIIAASLVITGISPFIAPQSAGNPPCSNCHANYHQYLDVLEGDPQNVLPPILNDSQYLTISVMVKNICNAPKYNIMSSISVTLSSQNGYFGVQSPTCNIGALAPDQAAKASWTIFDKQRGNDSLLINAQGANTHFTSFSDSYFPAPVIFVNKTVIDNPPTIAISSPLSGPRLTGGTDHQVSWYASDEDKPNCRVNLYYSTDDFRTDNQTVATQIPADQSFLWTLPLIDSETVKLKASIVDPKGHYRDTTMGGCFTIDSTPPSVSSVSPPDKQANVTSSAILMAMFSEPVARSSLQYSFKIVPDPGWMTWSWNSEQTVVTATHAPFAPGTKYTCTFSTDLKDVSLPGNSLRDTFSWTFDTPSIMTQAPSIMLTGPSGGERYWWGDKIPVRWSASGGTGVLGINISFSEDGSAGTFNIVANHLSNTGNLSLNAPRVASGGCVLMATVYDQTGLEANDLGGTFSIARNMVLNATFPAPQAPIQAGDTVELSWSITGGHGTASLALYFRPDANSTGQLVASDLPRSGNYLWTAPELNSIDARFTLNATDDWNRSVEASSGDLSIKTSLRRRRPGSTIRRWSSTTSMKTTSWPRRRRHSMPPALLTPTGIPPIISGISGMGAVRSIFQDRL